MTGLMVSGGEPGDSCGPLNDFQCLASLRRWRRWSCMLAAFAFGSFLVSAMVNWASAPRWAGEINMADRWLDYLVPCTLANVSCSSRGFCGPCTYGLQKLGESNMTAFNYTTKITLGGSNTFLYRIMGPRRDAHEQLSLDQTPSRLATDILVKVSCLPFFKHSYVTYRFVPRILKPWFQKRERGQVYRDWLGFPCKTIVEGDLNSRDVAMWKLANKCNVGHLMEEVRIGRVQGKMPEADYELDSEAVFLKEVKGLTLKHFTQMMDNSDVQEDFFRNKLNSSQVVEAAIFDLFTRQADRHNKNVFVNEKGNIKLIDNNKCLGQKLDSLFLPSTRRHTASLTGKDYTKRPMPELLWENPSLDARMDYRCHSYGLIGKNYPPGLLQCMKDISNSSIEDIMLDLGIEERSLIANLKQSGADMLRMGFEWTLYNGGPKRTGGGGYFPQPPCCEIIRSRNASESNLNKFLCEEGWELTDIHHSFHYTSD